MTMAQADETVIICGCSHYSVSDEDAYFIHSSVRLYAWGGPMTDYYRDDDGDEDWQLLWRAAAAEDRRTKKRITKSCTDAALRLLQTDTGSFVTDASPWQEKRERERNERISKAQERHDLWRQDMMGMLSFIRNKAETPFSGERPTRMHVLTWFEKDPCGLKPLMHTFDMTWYFIPYVYDSSADWVILNDDDSELLDADPMEFDRMDMREANLDHLVEELENSDPRIRVCTYSDAFSALSGTSVPDPEAVIQEDRKRFRKAGLVKDTACLEFRNTRIAFLNPHFDAQYAAMMSRENVNRVITADTAGLIGAESIELEWWMDDGDLPGIDYLVIGPQTDEEDDLLLEMVKRKKKTGNPLILLEDDYLKCVTGILEKENEKIRKAATAPSVFNADRYDYPGSDAVLKRAKTTVGVPLDVDTEKNTCRFVSRSSGEEYFTSLAACTCPAYVKSDGQRPCKHMFRLALELGKLKGRKKSGE
ncbi:MAG: hypothetical protein CW338_02655 [Clostridiales bacterium]|nr:hypothetical protein [Clostridiales bacterium]